MDAGNIWFITMPSFIGCYVSVLQGFGCRAINKPHSIFRSMCPRLGKELGHEKHGHRVLHYSAVCPFSHTILWEN